MYRYLLLLVFVLPLSTYAEIGDVYEDEIALINGWANYTYSGEGDPWTDSEYAMVYYASTTFTLGAIEIPIYQNLSYSSSTVDLSAWVLLGSTTGSKYELPVVGNSLRVTPEATTSPAYDDVYHTFEFPYGVPLVAGQTYTIQFEVLSYDEEELRSIGVGMRTTKTLPHTNHSYYLTSDGSHTANTYSSAYGGYHPRYRLYEHAIAETAAPIQLSLPCTTNSLETTKCSYGHASTSPYIEIQGTSTPIQSWIGGTYDLFYVLEDANGYVIDYDRLVGLDDNSTYPFYTYLEWDNPTELLGNLRVCQVPSDGSTEIVDPNYCAEALIGYDISTASTTQFGQLFGRITTDTADDRLDQAEEIVAACDDTSGFFNAIKCALWDLFVPTDTSTQAFTKLKDTVLYVVPIGYATHMIEDIQELEATSTTWGLSTGFGMDVSYATTTLSLPLTAYGETIDNDFPGLVTLFNWFIWILFSLWLFRFVMSLRVQS